MPLTARAVQAIESLPRRLNTPLLFPAPKGGYIGLDTWRTREWYPALGAAAIAKRGPYALRHTFATEALAGVSIFELARLMGTSVRMINRTYDHLARDSEDAIVQSSNSAPREMAWKWRRPRTTASVARGGKAALEGPRLE